MFDGAKDGRRETGAALKKHHHAESPTHKLKELQSTERVFRVRHGLQYVPGAASWRPLIAYPLDGRFPELNLVTLIAELRDKYFS